MSGTGEDTPFVGSQKKKRNVLFVVVRQHGTSRTNCFPIIVEKDKLNSSFLSEVVSKAIGEDARNFLWSDWWGRKLPLGPSLIGCGAKNPDAVVKHVSPRFQCVRDDVEIVENSTLYLTPRGLFDESLRALPADAVRSLSDSGARHEKGPELTPEQLQVKKNL